MASFPANVYGGGCKRLQEWLQTFAGTFAMLCVREGQRGTEIASPTMYKRKGEERFTIWGTGSPREFAQPFLRGPMYDI